MNLLVDGETFFGHFDGNQIVPDDYPNEPNKPLFVFMKLSMKYFAKLVQPDMVVESHFLSPDIALHIIAGVEYEKDNPILIFATDDDGKSRRIGKIKSGSMSHERVRRMLDGMKSKLAKSWHEQ